MDAFMHICVYVDIIASGVLHVSPKTDFGTTNCSHVCFVSITNHLPAAGKVASPKQ